MSGAGKKIADVAVKASKGIDWDGMAKLLVSEEARKKFSSLHVAFDEVRSTLQTKFSQELEPIDLEYCKKGVGSGLVDMYKEAYQQCNIWDTSRSMPIHSDGRDDRLVCEADPKDRDSIKSAYTIAYKAESLVINNPLNPPFVLEKSNLMLNEYLEAGNALQQVKKRKKLAQVKWKAPDEGEIKINFDASRKQNGQCAFGCIVRNHQGYILETKSGKIEKTSTQMAEAWAARVAHDLAKKYKHDKVWIEGDSRLIIECLQMKLEPPCMIKNLIDECQVAAREKCLDVGYKHILREANQAADWLAHRGHTSVKIDHVNLPWGLKFICLFDFWGRATPRSV
ncbi:PREDICTED: uncharacterized protein LOC104594770 isoform X1 [Nelumbo nucifera]|uniref:Uncharacterized protein LOC104594770 isoform X1 n=1 Tax=Nelumbo nucifera TaxID=4432 RepID=A0A1U7ZP11_NELNU|nr:PREDICTED: uncharacterized protein LOC104594770 isoform X1 [Nelumbo nucifera]